MTPAEIKTLRAELGWPQVRLAEYCRVHVQTVKKWEAGIHPPSGPAVVLLEMLRVTG